MKGPVIMEMTRSTNMTSTRGVMLISFMNLIGFVLCSEGHDAQPFLSGTTLAPTPLWTRAPVTK